MNKTLINDLICYVIFFDVSATGCVRLVSEANSLRCGNCPNNFLNVQSILKAL